MEAAQVAGFFLQPGAVTEVRALGVGGHGNTWAGYFDDSEKLAAALLRLDKMDARGTYITLNPVTPALLARCANRVARADRSIPLTSDGDISGRCWLPIDFDPTRPAGVSSSDAEHALALSRAGECAEYLTAEGWSKPVSADSGNGTHLLYRIELPNDAASSGIVKRCLEALSLRFGGRGVEVDTSVFNAARIWKAYGTTARKGDSTSDRPHRLARLLHVPERVQIVSADLLDNLAAEVPEPAAVKRRTESGEIRIGLERFLDAAGIEHDKGKPWNGGTLWRLPACPFDSTHTPGGTYAIAFPSGAVLVRCHHNRCQGKGWQDLRDAYPDALRRARDGGLAAREQRPVADVNMREARGAEAPEAERAAMLPAPLDMAEALDVEPPDVDEPIPGLTAGEVGLLAGVGGMGKTWFEILVATYVAAGLPLFGDPRWPTGCGGRVVLLLGEDLAARIRHRIWRFGETLRTTTLDGAPLLDALRSKVEIRPLVGTKAILVDAEENRTSFFEAVAQAVEGARLVVFDPLAKFHTMDENANVQMDHLFGEFAALGRSTGATILVAHHVSKLAALSGQDVQQAARGASAVVDAARWAAVMRKPSPDEINQRIGSGGKARYVLVHFPKTNNIDEPHDLWLRRGIGGILERAPERDPKDDKDSVNGAETSRGKGRKRSGVAIDGIFGKNRPDDERAVSGNAE